MQDSFAETAGARAIHQEAENVAADSGSTELRHNGHAADLHFTVAMIEHPAASNCVAAKRRERMKCLRIVSVELDLFRNVLLFDKDAAPNRIGARHVRGRFDREDFYRNASHKIFCSARIASASNALIAESEAMLRSRRKGARRLNLSWRRTM